MRLDPFHFYGIYPLLVLKFVWIGVIVGNGSNAISIING